MEENTKIKNQGQVFTPKHIVQDILDISGYTGEKILEKNVIDNSCGDGAFLVEFIKRYIKEYEKKYKTKKDIEEHLEKYIHGIEKDEKIYNKCIEKLNNIIKKEKLQKVNWDIINENTLEINKYDGKMDFVIGNPPYVRVHNLENQYNKVKEYSFCNTGMTDLYIVFFEIGLKMLNKDGVLCYITPNSFCNSLAGNELRKYLKENRNLESLYDLGHYQPFDVTTYTMITKICNKKVFEKCKYYKYDINTEKPKYMCDIEYKNLFIDQKIVLSNNNERYIKYLNYDIKKDEKVQVKNGFATLNDNIFIQNNFNFKNNIIDVIKASTGEWKKCIYPYNKYGKIINFNELDKDVQKYLKSNKKNLNKKDDKKLDSLWYGFGRSQAINDVQKNKLSINTMIKDIESIKINEVEKGKGIYSGLYILTEVSKDKIKELICSETFINYLKIINKCKRGGYYTYSSKELAKYLNCELEDYNE